MTTWTVACQAPLSTGTLQEKSTGVGSHYLLQGIFPTPGLNLDLLNRRQALYHLSYEGISLSIHITPRRSLPPHPHPTPSGITEPQAGLPVLCHNFPITIYCTLGNVCISALCSICPTLFFPSVSTSHSLCLCLYSCSANRLISTIF